MPSLISISDLRRCYEHHETQEGQTLNLFVCAYLWTWEKEKDSLNREMGHNRKDNVTMWQFILVKCFPKYTFTAFQGQNDALWSKEPQHNPLALNLVFFFLLFLEQEGHARSFCSAGSQFVFQRRTEQQANSGGVLSRCFAPAVAAVRAWELSLERSGNRPLNTKGVSYPARLTPSCRRRPLPRVQQQVRNLCTDSTGDGSPAARQRRVASQREDKFRHPSSLFSMWSSEIKKTNKASAMNVDFLSGT